MSDDLSPGFAIVLAITMATSFIWAIAEVGRRTAVRGSRPRYVFATVERTTRWPCLLYFLMSVTTDRIYGSWTFFIVDSAAIGLWVFVQWERRRKGDDDDDFWTTVGKKLRQRLAAGRALPQGAVGRTATGVRRTGLASSRSSGGLTGPVRHRAAVKTLDPPSCALRAVAS